MIPFRPVLVAAVAALLVAAAPPGAATPQQPVSLKAEAADLSIVLKILAEKGGLNLITGPAVTSSKITIDIKEVPVEQAVNLVVRAAGLAYERIGNSILVTDAKSLQEETGLSSYVVNLKFADATEVKDALRGLTDKIEVDRGGNRLIVVTSPRIISEIEEIVADLDRPARQVMLEARIVEVSTDDFKNLGIDWDLLSRQGFMFVEGNYDSLQGGESADQVRGLKVFPNTPGTQDIFKLGNFSRVAQVYRVAMDLAIRNGSARVLANPKIATLNGREASMLVGSRIPFVISGTVFAGGGAAQAQQVEREEVGVKLAITPLINADGYITTVIRPEVSSVIGFKGPNEDLPIVATRQATTTVRLKDGGSVIIGGLLSEERTSSTTRLPILGSIPGLGLLFQHSNTTVAKKDLVIEVTPRILPEQP